MAEVTALFDDERVRKLLDRFQKNVFNVKESRSQYVKALAPGVFADIIRHFENESGPGGEWEPWSEAYAKVARARGQRQILQNKGYLRGNLTPIESGGNYRKTAEGILWYNNKPYARRHDEGTDGMPKREFMWLSDKAMAVVAQSTLDFVTKG